VHVHGPACDHGVPPASDDLDPHKPFLERYAKYAPPEDVDAVLIRLEKLKDLLDKKQRALSPGRQPHGAANDERRRAASGAPSVPNRRVDGAT